MYRERQTDRKTGIESDACMAINVYMSLSSNCPKWTQQQIKLAESTNSWISALKISNQL